MFYSEQLLSKTGPLARVWLASNVERKLSKSQILQSDISSSVGVIVDQGQAPMALRLSGQLMLGVVRIYGRKARYLLDDCNEALLKIRMTFKNTNNHDLPSQLTTTVDLNLPELLTIDDLFPSMDFAYPLTQQPATDNNERPLDFDEDWTSSLNPQTQSVQSRLTPEGPLIQDDDLALDLGEDVGMDDTAISMQLGRQEQTPRPDEPSGLPAFDDGEGLQLDLGDDVAMPDSPGFPQEGPAMTVEGQYDAPGFGDDETLQLRGATEGPPAPRRDTESPLSEADPDMMQELDRTFAQQQEVEEAEEVVATQRQQGRKQKPMVADRETVLHNSEIKAFAADRSRILRPASFLPEDPVLLALINMQKNGDFVTNAMNDGRSKNWAPELQGLLSFEVVHRLGQLKRKRDSGIADISDDERSDKSPRLDDAHDAQVEETLLEDEGVQVEQEPLAPGEFPEVHEPIATDEPALQGMAFGEDDEGIYVGEGGFDDTTIPLVHPADSGPVSVGTKHAVHLLRETFGGPPSEGSPSSQTRTSVLLQDLVPEGRTSKEDATKMFFEILVLATKDAIKVEQSDKEIGLPIRVRAKRGLWGAWAEPSPSDNIGSQEVAVPG